MAEPLRHFFDERVVSSIGRDLGRAWPALDQRAFVEASLDGLEALSLTKRAAHVCEAMRRCLPSDYVESARVLIASLGPPLGQVGGFGLEPLRYMPHTIFAARYGLGDFETSMRFLYELTQRFSAEFSVRAFLVAFPEPTYARLTAWAEDPNVHVRRLVSEGTRPRLPWAKRLRDYQRDPSPVLALLERLKDDPERFVQRSVANSLNDIAKDHSALVVRVCQEWSKDAPEGRRWIVKHALRSLVKRGDEGALRLLGISDAPRVRLGSVGFDPPRVSLGGTLRVSFELVSTVSDVQELLVDFAVHFVKASGRRRAKVFKLRRLSLDGGATVRFEAKVSFAEMTTRRHHRGTHAIDALVNGGVFPLGEFEVR